MGVTASTLVRAEGVEKKSKHALLSFDYCIVDPLDSDGEKRSEARALKGDWWVGAAEESIRSGEVEGEREDVLLCAISVNFAAIFMAIHWHGLASLVAD